MDFTNWDVDEALRGETRRRHRAHLHFAVHSERGSSDLATVICRLMLRGLALLIAGLWLFLGGNTVVLADETTPSVEGELQVLSVQLGTHVDSNKRVPVPYRSFRPSEPKILASVHTFVEASEPVNLTLGALWTFDTPDGPQTVIDDSIEGAFQGDDYTVFEISNTNAWPSGTYALHVFVQGSEAIKTTFVIK